MARTPIRDRVGNNGGSAVADPTAREFLRPADPALRELREFEKGT